MPIASGSVPSDKVVGSDRVCIVTGAGSGIGRATVLRLAAEGATVLAADIDGAAAEGTAALADGPGTVEPRVLDVADRAAFAAVVDGCAAAHGRLDVLVNNAAVNLPALFHEATAADVERTVAVNVLGVLHGCQLAVPHMLGRGTGSIVNVASVNGLVAERYLSVYAMSKGAVVMLSRGIALDYAGAGIRCNVVCPGWVDTPINDAHARLLGGREAVYADIASFQPIGRAGRPEEVANVIAFLAGDQSSFMTGSVVVADGGMTVH